MLLIKLRHQSSQTEPTLESGLDINIKRHGLTTWELKDLPHIPMKNKQSAAEDYSKTIELTRSHISLS